MKRIWGHVVSLLVVGMAVSAVLPACATNDQTIFIRERARAGAERGRTASARTRTIPRSRRCSRRRSISASADSYFAMLLVGNQLIPRSDPQNNRAESNRVHINGGDRAGDGAGRDAHPRVHVARHGLRRSGKQQRGGVRRRSASSALDAPTKDILLPTLPNRQRRETVLMNFKAFGTSLGGEDVESGEYQLPDRGL